MQKATVGMFDNVLFDNSKLIMFDWSPFWEFFFCDR